ncbi:uncharacterized protein LOC127876646 isoform X2 [Dreissena polymorpha]|uniref:uncharacterized protein LOC127876646 isoform X2 n=1 Tax=Dreissena polymorpha TaxID=45954 RepID=UPI00226530F8|nr:uncharacterized protein LOC127876646 isoform X2 [Dreissena polymorpha]
MATMTTQHITKTIETLEDIKKMQKEIMSLLDRIEQRTGKKEPVGFSRHVQGHEVVDSNDKMGMSVTESIEDDTRQVKNETDSGARPKMKNKASADFRVVEEDFQLSQEQANYGKSLRRNFVSLHQDNRLSVKFGYSPMEGKVGTIAHQTKESEPEIYVKPSHGLQGDALTYPTIQKVTDCTIHTVANIHAEKIELANDFTNSSPCTNENTESNDPESPPSTQSGDTSHSTELTQSHRKNENAEKGSQITNLPTAEGEELSQSHGKHKNAETGSQISHVPAAEGEELTQSHGKNKNAEKGSHISNTPAAATREAESTLARSLVESKLLENQSEPNGAAAGKSDSKDEGQSTDGDYSEDMGAIAEKSDSEDEGQSKDDDPSENMGKSALGIWSNVIATSLASGELAMTKESMTKLLKDSMKQMGLPDSEIIDHSINAYFEASMTQDGEFDLGKALYFQTSERTNPKLGILRLGLKRGGVKLTPEGISEILKDAVARSGIEDNSLVDQFTTGFVRATFTPEGKMDLRKMEEKFEQTAKGILGFILPGIDSHESEPGTDVSEGDTRAANRRSNRHQTSRPQEDSSPSEGIDINVWLDFAEKAKNEGRRASERRSPGMDTLFLLDVSGSMKGAAWDQATRFVKNFLECLQGSHDQAFEHVALVTFGGDTCVHQHLTCDYVQIGRKLDLLKPSGPSPLLGGVIMLEAAIMGGGQIFECNNYKIPPRVFLITDGKPTLSSFMDGVDSDRSTISPQEREAILNVVLRIHSSKIRFYTVPVGSADKRLLHEIASLTKGSVVSSKDWKIQAAAFKNYQLAATLGVEGLNPLLTGPMSEEDLQQCHDFLRRFKQKREKQEIEGLPPLGSRVELGTSYGRIGTVSKHSGDDNLDVIWDYPDDADTTRSTVSVQLVRQINMPRVLFDELIAPGCRVRRGPDWRYEDQDGGPGNIGSVYGVDISGIVKVRWDNGNLNTYRFGTNGMFDLAIVEGGHVPASGTHSFKTSRMNKNRSVASNNSPAKTQRPSPASKPKSTPAGTPISTTRTSKDRERMANLNRDNQPPVTVPGQWFWQRGNEWKPFADEGNALIEGKYQLNPNGTVVVDIDNESYRVVLPKLYMTHIFTKVKHNIERRKI